MFGTNDWSGLVTSLNKSNSVWTGIVLQNLGKSRSVVQQYHYQISGSQNSYCPGYLCGPHSVVQQISEARTLSAMGVESGGGTGGRFPRSRKISGTSPQNSNYDISVSLAAAAGRQRWGHGHGVTTKFWVGQDSDNQTHLPPKFIFSSDFGHLILKMLKIKMLLPNACPFLRGLCSFRFAVSWIPFVVHCSVCLFALQCT